MGVGKLFGILIKQQHNCLSDGHDSSSTRIKHEFLLIFVKDHRIISIGQYLLDKDLRLSRRRAGTWKQIIRQIVQELGGEVSIEQATKTVLERINPDGNQHVAEKVRQGFAGPDVFKDITGTLCAKFYRQILNSVRDNKFNPALSASSFFFFFLV